MEAVIDHRVPEAVVWVKLRDESARRAVIVWSETNAICPHATCDTGCEHEELALLVYNAKRSA